VNIQPDVPLAPLTTLGLGGAARRLARVVDVGELETVLREAEAANERVLVLGGGSNLVIGDAGWDGLVIQLAMPEIRVHRHDGFAIVSASAGAVWDDFVAEMVDAKLAGVECLSGIPGQTGATPMQNVGAYGQEVAETIVFVRAYDRVAKEVVTLEPRDCHFGYRTSVFRGSERWIILEVRFQFAIGDRSRPIRYAELSRALDIADGESAPLGEVRDTVIALRRGKGMVVDPKDPESRSAGSFFTNPIVDPATFAALETRLPGLTIPHWSQPDGATKLSAAWLIERAGFSKGYSRGNVGISRKHALALVNRGGATTHELLELAREIQDGVRGKLGIDLTMEPIVV
jgi:UDP-N-acetylmuramate dehydrogenase